MYITFPPSYICLIVFKKWKVAQPVHHPIAFCWSLLFSFSSYYQYTAFDEAVLEKTCRVSRQSLFMEKPMTAFEVNFELLHSGIASLPGKSVIYSVVLLEVVKNMWMEIL